MRRTALAGQPVAFLSFVILTSVLVATARAQNNLEVISPHGSPVPTVGTTIYAGPVDTVECYVPDSPVILSNGTRYVCTGWTGTGSVPASGSGTNVTVTLDGDSTITWLWQTQAVMYVSLTGGGVPPYDSWADAATTIEAAVAAAADGTRIFVSNGTYSVGSEIMLTNSLLLKGYAGPGSTIIQRTGTGRCVTLSSDSSIEDCTITGGNVTTGAGTNTYGFAGRWGGGVFLDKGGVVSNCIIRANSAEKGGGVFFYGGGTVLASVIVSNTAVTASFGGYGGGVYFNSNGLIRSSLITRNTSDLGGGVRSYYGGEIQNCTIARNTARDEGGGVSAWYGGQVRNSIVYYNTDSYAFGTTSNYFGFGTGLKFYYTCTRPTVPGGYSGGGNITSLPQLADYPNDNYTLLPTSPCIDVGLNASWMAAALDVAGTNRILNGVVDMGAYEAVPPMITSWAGSGGTITPSGIYTAVSSIGGTQVVSVAYNHNLTYNMTPGLYYRVGDVVVDGISVGATNSYTFTGVISNHTIHASFVLNRPILSVYSLYGTNDTNNIRPWIGDHEYEAGAAVRCRILDAGGETNGLERYVFTGWTGTGNVPATGTGGTTPYFYIYQASSITWNWKTQYLFTASSMSTNGSVSPTNTWLDAGSTNNFVTATPKPGYSFVNWTGDVAPADATNNPLRLIMDQPRSVTANWDVVSVTLTVSTPINGNPSPAAGIWTNNWGTPVTCTMGVSSVADGVRTQYVCTGWTGTGNVPASGTGTAVPTFSHTTNSTITWKWKTQYRLATAFGPNGVVLPVYAWPGQWFDAGTVRQISAIPFDPGGTNVYRFAGWTGDVPAGQEYVNPLDLVMDRARSVTGNFEYVPQVMYVSPGGSHTFPFASWATAATNISTAVDAGGLGSLIHVGDGTYALSRTVNMDDNITLISENGAGSTIIDGRDLYRCVQMSHSNAVMDGFTIRNGAADKGAGVWIGSNAVVRNCVIEDSSASNRGGGVYMDYSGTLDHCIVRGNSATSRGAGVSVKSGGLVRNCLIVRNGSLTAPPEGGGIHLDGGGTIESSTVATNMAASIGGGAYLNGGSVLNTIVYHNRTAGGSGAYNISIPSGATPTISHTCSYPEPSGSNNEELAPRFKDIAADDYTLLEGSICIDHGLAQAWMAAATDLAGAARVQGAWVDMGAYEGYTPVYLIVAGCDAGGVISPKGNVVVTEHGSVTFTIVPTGTNYIEGLVVDSLSVAATNSYTFSNVTAPHTIYAVFAGGASTTPLGTPIWWLDLYGLDAGDDETDSDGDGHEVWEEYIADTNPNDGMSYLHVTGADKVGSTHVITWPSSAFRVYSLVTRTDLTSGSWGYLAGHTGLVGVAGSMTRTNTLPLNVQYYRVEVKLP